MSVDATLLSRALSARTGTVCTALATMIHDGHWLLDDEALRTLDARHDPHIDGWLFAWRVMSSPDAARDDGIRRGIADPNPRVREHACDLAGDLQRHALRPLLVALFEDEDANVREAARCNAGMLAG
jgi:hypothetical protein